MTRFAESQRPNASRMAGVTLIEMMVTLLIGSFLIIGAVSIFGQSRTSYRTTDTTSRLQENARFAMSQIEPDIRLAQFFGMNNKPLLTPLPAPLFPITCGGNNVSAWALSIANAIQATNSAYPLAGQCNPFNNAWQANTDTLAVRHASGQPTAATVNTIQIQSTRVSGALFNTGVVPLGAACLATVPPTCNLNDLQVHLYYVSAQSSLGIPPPPLPPTPSLRRLTLVNGGIIQDQEIVTGVEDFQVQLGVDTNNDNTVERYVNATDPILAAANSRILAVRYWLLLRADQVEIGYTNNTQYQYADVPQFTRNDGFRRLIVSNTILLRNARG